MNSLLFSVLAATSLVAVGMGAPGETRSAQSLPDLVVPAVHPAASGDFHKLNRLADATPDSSGADQSGKAACERDGGHWDDSLTRCHRRIVWPVWPIAAGTTAGLIFALTSGDGTPSGDGTSGSQPAISQ